MVFRCESCRGEQTVEVDLNLVKEPQKCNHCSKRHCMRLQPNLSSYLNRQVRGCELAWA